MWEKKFGNPHKRTLKGVEMTTPKGKKFSMDKYRQSQETGTKWMAARSSRMLEFLNEMPKSRFKKKKQGSRKLTMKSYILQEAEAISREAKILWATNRGIRIMSLQHDGIVMKVTEDTEKIRVELEKAASSACGYAISMKAKLL